MLVVDREPIRWEGGSQRGLAWSERVEMFSGAGIGDWRDAACAGAACGLVIEGRRSYVHSSVAGVAPVYYMEHDGAVYLATTIDALALASPRRLSVDWEAWAAILSLTYPLGQRTPFAEIRRLPPFSMLRVRRGKAYVDERPWPWAEVEPSLDVGAGAADVVEALRASVARLPAGPITCPLSGGLDSRLCLGLLAESRRDDVSALTADPETGTDREIRIAARVAETIGVPHHAVAGDPADYWSDLELRLLRVDYQFIRSPWQMPELLPLRKAGGIAIDGFGFDVLAVPGDRVFVAETIDPRGDDAVVEAVWNLTRDRAERRISRVMRGRLGSALWASAHRQFTAESEQFRGHAARAVLTFYRTRQVRGIAMAPHSILGADVPTAVPLVDDLVARCALAISPQSKAGGTLYDAVFEAIDPRLRGIGTDRRGEALPGESPLRRRGDTASVADALHASVTNGPLAPWIRPSALRRLTRHHRKKQPRPPRGMLEIVAFHLWCERYRHVLGEIDVAEGFGVAPRTPHPG